MKTYRLYLISSIFLASTSYAEVDFNKLYQSWSNEKQIQASAVTGERLWNKKGISGKSCASCHNSNLKRSGSHIKTKKIIKPLSPRTNRKRLSSIKQINKWLRRNCKFVYKRTCSASEKINFIEFIRRN